MKTTTKRNGRALSMPAGLAYGALVSVAMLLSFCAIIAKLILSGVMAEKNIGYGVLLLLLLSSFMGAWVAYRKIKRQRLLSCILSGVLYLSILLSVTALFFGGRYEAVGVTTALILGGSIAASLIGNKEKRVGKRRK